LGAKIRSWKKKRRSRSQKGEGEGIVSTFFSVFGKKEGQKVPLKAFGRGRGPIGPGLPAKGSWDQK